MILPEEIFELLKREPLTASCTGYDAENCGFRARSFDKKVTRSV